MQCFRSRSQLLSHDSPNRKRGVLKGEPTDNDWYGKKASKVTLTTWEVERHWVLRTKVVNGYSAPWQFCKRRTTLAQREGFSIGSG